MLPTTEDEIILILLTFFFFFLSYKSANGFEIRKRIGNSVEYFGRFNNLETAIDELQVCQECNWDIDLMVEL